MYNALFEKYFDSSSGTIYFPINGDMEVLMLCFPYGYKSDSNGGYAHLLEHMIIRSNSAEIEKICGFGVLFNAVTREYSTEYTFMNLRGGNVLAKQQKKIEQLFSAIQFGENLEKILSTEKKVIIEEYAILEQRFTAEEAMKMVGSRLQIEQFSLIKMLHIFEQFYKNRSTIVLRKSKDIPCTYESLVKTSRGFVKKDILIKKQKGKWYLRSCIESKIIIFFLHICCISQVLKKWDFKTAEDKDEIEVEILGEFQIIDKEHILNRYSLLCTNFKFYMEEIGWIVRSSLIYLNIESCFFKNWEGIFYEC